MGYVMWGELIHLPVFPNTGGEQLLFIYQGGQSTPIAKVTGIVGKQVI